MSKSLVYRSKLNKIIKYIQDLDTGGGVKIFDLSDPMGLSPRMVQRYISDLVKLGLIIRRPERKVSLNNEYVKFVEDSLGYVPGQLTLDDFMLVINCADPILRLRDNLMPILRKLKAPLEMVPQLRIKLISTNPNSLRVKKNLIGNKLLYTDYVQDSIITSGITGLAGVGRASFMRGGPWGVICVYTACAASASWFLEIKRDEKIEDYLLFKPDLRRIKETDIPFRELFTEFPALRKVGYGLIVHYITELTNYKLAIETLEKFGKKVEFIFRLGSLIPHGFLSGLSERDEAFRELKFEFVETFTSFCSLAKNLSITPVGVVIDPKDRWYSNNVCKEIMGIDEDVEIRDHFLLNMVMHEKDVTCLIQRDELGKSLKDFYEFYIKNKHVVTRYEFLNLKGDNPIELQKRIAEIAYNTSSPYPHRYIRSNSGVEGWNQREQLMAPFVAHEASYNAMIQLDKLQKYTKIALRYGFEKLWGENYDERTGNNNLR